MVYVNRGVSTLYFRKLGFGSHIRNLNRLNHKKLYNSYNNTKYHNLIIYNHSKFHNFILKFKLRLRFYHFTMFNGGHIEFSSHVRYFKHALSMKKIDYCYKFFFTKFRYLNPEISIGVLLFNNV